MTAIVLMLTALAMALPATAASSTVITQSYPTAEGSQPMDVYLPSGHGPHPGIVFVHGGAWVSGARAEFAQQANAAAQRGYVGFSIDYDMDAPRYPGEVLDVESAINSIRAHAADYGLDPTKLTGWGESAGAHLLMQAALSGKSPLNGIVSWSGPYDFPAVFDDGNPELQGYIEKFLGCDASAAACGELAAQASPVNYVSSRPPPAMLVDSRNELVPASQLDEMARKLGAHGGYVRITEFTGQRHGYDYADDATAPSMSFLDRIFAPNFSY
jgi:acetyl esterase/lipase